MFDRRNVIAALLAGALAAGCSEGTTDPPDMSDDRLSEAESLALFEAMRAIQGDTAAIIGGSEAGIVLACPLGGQVALTGDAVDESVADTVRLTSDFTASPTGCQVSSGGMRFTVDGRPSVRERTTVSFIGLFEALTLEGSVIGALDWQSDGRSGSCDIDLTLSGGLDASGTALAAVLAGTLCGHETRLDVEEVAGGPSG